MQETLLIKILSVIHDAEFFVNEKKNKIFAVYIFYALPY